MRRRAVLFEPVSAFFATSILFGLATVGEVVFTAATLALSIGISILTAPKAPRFGQQSTERTATVSSPVRPLFFVIGETRVGTHRTDSQTDSGGDLWRTQVMSCEEIDSIRQIFVNNEPVTLDASGFVQSPSKWLNKLRIISRLGTDDQTVVTEMQTDLPAVVTSDYRLRGLAYLAIEQQPVGIGVVNDTWPRGPTGEEITVLLRGAKLYDPRTETTVWSDNAVLGLLHVMMHEYGGNLGLESFELTSWEAAADIADTEDVGPDGTKLPRYRVSGIWEAPTGDDAPAKLRQLIDDLRRNCNARIYRDSDQGGKIGIVLDSPALNATTFNGADVLAVQLGPAETLITRRDAMTGIFPNESNGYSDDSTPHYPSSVSAPQAIEGVPLSFCPGRTQAYRIVKQRFLEATSNTAAISMNAAGLLVHEGERVAFDMPEIPTGSYIVERWKCGPSDRPVVSLECIETPDGYGEFDGATELTAEELPAAVTVEGVAISDPEYCSGSSDEAGTIRAVWAEPDEPGLSAEIQWSETGAGVFNPGVVVFDATDRIATFDASDATGNIDVRMRFKQLTGGATAWVADNNIDPDTFVSAPTTPTISGMSSGAFESGSGSAPGVFTFTGNWTASQCVYLIRVFADVGTNPPTTQRGDDIQVVDGDKPIALSCSGFTVSNGDTVRIRIEVENVSGQTTQSATTSVAITVVPPS